MTDYGTLEGMRDNTVPGRIVHIKQMAYHGSVHEFEEWCSYVSDYCPMTKSLTYDYYDYSLQKGGRLYDCIISLLRRGNLIIPDGGNVHEYTRKYIHELFSEEDRDYCRITEIPAVLTRLANLQELTMCYHNLARIPPSMVNLHTLVCRNNKLRSIPPELVNLKVLKCSNNPLDSIPNTLVLLEKLVCDYTKVSYIPPELVGLKKLKIRKTEISELPDTLVNLKRVKFDWPIDIYLLMLNNQELFKYDRENIFLEQERFHATANIRKSARIG